ncbi:MAG: selenocysteine-specific translation elongation factor [Chloroflexota bacterium]
MYVIGTAGHIDHGKSTLVKALTGIDPDRLREEKERGMTIDLGFAWLRLPSGREVSVVDVPGHERFIKNMLAGVGGIDLALLVIAADEGIMPQTEEHLAILELLRAKRAVVALTKRDLVEDDWLELVRADVAERVERSELRGAPILAVSATTGAGLPDLLSALDQALDDTPPKPDLGRPRVPIDRVFTIAGFGTVVTGTLVDGALRVGEDLEIQPGGPRTRARGIQTHKQKVEQAPPGARVAVNLVGLGVDDLRRGQVVTTPGWLHPTLAVDARVRVLSQAPPLAHNARVSFHTGSAETMALVRVLDADSIAPGQDGWAQLRFAEPVAVVKGDRFVLRSPNETLGGGEVIELHARRHRRQQDDVVQRLEILEQGAPGDILVNALAGRFGKGVAAIGETTGFSADRVHALIEQLLDAGRIVRLGDAYLPTAALDALRSEVERALDDYHRRFPLRDGMPREELKSRLHLSGRDFSALVDHLGASIAIVVEDSIVRLPAHRVALSAEQERRVREFLAELGAQPYAPPSLDDLVTRFEIDDELLAALVGLGRIVRVSESIAFAADAFAALRSRIVERAREQGSISVSEVRDLFDTSRKYALALLEYFDQERLTRRVGDARVLR